jgi:hypothetical protein
VTDVPISTSPIMRPGIAQGEIYGQPATHGAADKDRGMNAKGIEHGLEIIDVVEGLVFRHRLAIAAPVIGHDMPAGIGDGLHLFGPHALVADARMKEDDRQPLPYFHAGKLGPTDIELEWLQ